MKRNNVILIFLSFFMVADLLFSCTNKETSNPLGSFCSTETEIAVPAETFSPPAKLIYNESEAYNMNQNNSLMKDLMQKVDNYTTPMTWLFVGDSITANDGNAAEEYSGYPEIFKSYLTNGLCRLNDKVINTAVSGWRIANIDYQTCVGDFQPDIAFCNIGTNDSFTTDADADTFTTAVTALIKKMQENGVIPVLIASGSFSDNWGDINQKNNFAKRYYGCIQRVLAETHALFVDFYSRYEQDRAHSSAYYFCSDTVHPSRAGFLFMTQILIADLGLGVANCPILETAPEKVYENEILPDMLSVWANEEDHISCSSDAVEIREAANKSFCLLGGSSAVGRSGTFITRRPIDRLLDNNLKYGKHSTAYGSLASLLAMLKEDTLTESVFFLMPEAFGITGDDLICGDVSVLLADFVDTARAKGKYTVFITPPTAAEEKNAFIVSAMKTIALKKNVTLIDLDGYFSRLIAQDISLKEILFDKNGVISAAGSVEASTLIAAFTGADSSFFSSRAFDEHFEPAIWGTQGAAGFTYLYQMKNSDTPAELAFTPDDKTDSTHPNQFTYPGKNVELFIGQSVFSVLPSAYVIKRFTIPMSGEVKITVRMKSHSSDNELFLRIENDGKIVKINGKTELPYMINYGAYQTYTVTVKVKAGTYLDFISESKTLNRGYLLEKITYTDK